MMISESGIFVSKNPVYPDCIFMSKILIKVQDKEKNFQSAHVVIIKDGNILIVKRSDTDQWMPNHYGLPGGKLDQKSIQYYSTEGKSPRNFTLNKEGNWLLVANQDSDNIIAFRRNIQTGALSSQGVSIKLSMPVCLLFY